MRLRKLNGETLKPGDIVKCQGITSTIKSISFQEPWKWRKAYYTEFTDTKGNYRSWKQGTDGGVIIDGGDAYRRVLTLRDLLNKYGHLVVANALNNLFKNGYEFALKITDDFIDKEYQKEIEKQEKEREDKPNTISYFSPEFVRDTLIVERELSYNFTNKNGLVDFINDIASADLFENPERPVTYDRVKNLLTFAVGCMFRNDGDWEEGDIKSVCDYLANDSVDDLLNLGIISDEMWNKYYEGDE